MPIEIEGVEHFTAADIHRMLGITRQTVWRWRTARKIPQWRRYRDRNIVFTHQELETIREYANCLEPADSPQLHRISGASNGGAKGGRVMSPRISQQRVTP